jgi:hypothetical protein
VSEKPHAACKIAAYHILLIIMLLCLSLVAIIMVCCPSRISVTRLLMQAKHRLGYLLRGATCGQYLPLGVLCLLFLLQKDATSLWVISDDDRAIFDFNFFQCFEEHLAAAQGVVGLVKNSNIPHEDHVQILQIRVDGQSIEEICPTLNSCLNFWLVRLLDVGVLFLISVIWC